MKKNDGEGVCPNSESREDPKEIERKETEKLITKLRPNPEKSKILFMTSKSEGFEFLITKIWWEVYQPEFQYRLFEHLDLDSEEIESLPENYISDCFEKISQEMAVFLDSDSGNSSD